MANGNGRIWQSNALYTDSNNHKDPTFEPRLRGKRISQENNMSHHPILQNTMQWSIKLGKLLHRILKKNNVNYFENNKTCSYCKSQNRLPVRMQITTTKIVEDRILFKSSTSASAFHTTLCFGNIGNTSTWRGLHILQISGRCPHDRTATVDSNVDRMGTSSWRSRI